MAFDFPASPTVNQIFTPVAGTSYVWNGQAWLQNGVALGVFAPIDSPTLTGDPKAPTPVSTDNDTSLATTAFVKANLPVKVTVAASAPSSPATNDLWVDTT